VEVSKDWYGLIPGICGLTTHVNYDYTFRMPGQKAEYRTEEIQTVPASTNAKPYEGSISISRAKNHVIVKLSQRGYDQKSYPFELNGTYRYYSNP
jgi:hypothetical protein